MFVVLHTGHGHGPDPAVLALLAVVVVLGVMAGVAAIWRMQGRRR